MGVTQMFADTRKAQQGDGVIQVTIPADVADELGIEPSDEILWTAHEGEETAAIHAPGSTAPSFPAARD